MVNGVIYSPGPKIYTHRIRGREDKNKAFLACKKCNYTLFLLEIKDLSDVKIRCVKCKKIVYTDNNFIPIHKYNIK